MIRGWTHSSRQIWADPVIQQFELTMLPVFEKQREGVKRVRLHGDRLVKDISSKTQNCGPGIFQDHKILSSAKAILFHRNSQYFQLDQYIAHTFADTSFLCYRLL